MLYSITRSTWLYRLRGFFTWRFSIILGFIIFTIISRCAWISDGVYVDIIIGLLIGTKLLLSTKAYELFGVGADWMAFVILFVSRRITATAFPASATSFVIAFVSWLIRTAYCDAVAVCCTAMAVVWTVSAVVLTVVVVDFKSFWIVVRACMTVL